MKSFQLHIVNPETHISALRGEEGPQMRHEQGHTSLDVHALLLAISDDRADQMSFIMLDESLPTQVLLVV